MKKIWKLCLLLCVLLLLGGCSQEEEKKETGAETTAESVKQTEEQDQADTGNKAILSQDSKNPLSFSFDYDPADYLQMDGNYQSITLLKEDLNVTEEDIQSEVDSLLLEHAKLEEVTDREALDGDTLEIDFTGTLDGETIYDEKNYQMELGSSGMVSGFEEGLEGSKAGDKITLDLKYPEDYGDDLLNGKTVHFEITVHHVYLSVVPDYTDQFVAEYTNYDTVDAYEAFLNNRLKQIKKEDAVAVWMDEHTKMDSCPDALKEKYGQRMLDYFALVAETDYQTDLKGLLKQMNYASEKEFLEDKDNEEAILENIRRDLSYDYIVVKEKISSTVGEYLAFMEEYAETIGYQDADKLLDYFEEDEIRQLYIKKLATDWMLEHAVEK